MTRRMAQEARAAMISRIRIEALAPDPETCRRDLFAAVHQLLGVSPGVDPADVKDPAIYHSSWVVDEHYERLPWNERTHPDMGEATSFKGRVSIGMPVNYGDSRHASPDGLGLLVSVPPPATPDDTAECEHHPDGVKWNPYNRVHQCHRCGQIMHVQPGRIEVGTVTVPVYVDSPSPTQSP